VVLLVLHDGSTLELSPDSPAKTIKTTKLKTQPLMNSVHMADHVAVEQPVAISSLAPSPCWQLWRFLPDVAVGNLLTNYSGLKLPQAGLTTASSQRGQATTVIQINTINLARKKEACWLEEEVVPGKS
jgi:hypothetical protein